VVCSVVVAAETTQHAQKAPAAEAVALLAALLTRLTRSLRSLVRWVVVLTSQGVPLSGCPFQSHPGVEDERRSRRSPGLRRTPDSRRAVLAVAVLAVAVLSRPRLLWRSRSWRTERATAGRAAGESLSSKIGDFWSRRKTVQSSPPFVVTDTLHRIFP